MSYTKRLADLQFKVTKTILIASGILFSLVICSDLFLGYYTIAFIKFPVLLTFLIAYIILIKKGFKEHYTHIVNIPILAFFAFNYISNQGTDGPTLYGAMALFVVYPILLTTRWKWFYTSFTLILAAILLYVGIDKSNLLKPVYNNAQEQFIDHVSTYILVGIYITILVGIIFNYYKKQNIELCLAQVELEEQIKLVKAEKRQKENLLGILAHDVKNPVNNLSQLIQMYQDDMLSQEELKELTNGMQSRIRDLQNTIEDILGQLKADIHNLQNGHQHANPIEITQKIINTIHYKLKTKNQTITFDHPENPKNKLTYGLNANEVSVVLKNLLDNAHKYSPNNTTIAINLQENEHTLIWEIIDHGDGIPEDLEQQLFKKAVLSNNGSGVGLFLCHSIAQSIGAQLQYFPQSKGSMFRLTVHLEKTCPV